MILVCFNKNITNNEKNTTNNQLVIKYFNENTKKVCILFGRYKHCLYLCTVKMIVKIISHFDLAKVLKNMKLTNKAKEKLKDKPTMRALEDSLNITIWTLCKWRAEKNTRFYRKSEAVREKFLEIIELTEDEAFEPDND